LCSGGDGDLRFEMEDRRGGRERARPSAPPHALGRGARRGEKRERRRHGLLKARATGGEGEEGEEEEHGLPAGV